ncbi:MAG: hypothetical protein K6A30_07565 [Lachnospiraceae bacterium]|nr:hypothetical protein [Lachnospiraceae bacterium]
MSREIQKSYKASMNQLSFGTYEKEHMVRAIMHEEKENEGGFHKMYNMRKVAAATAACVVLVGGSVFAAGKIANITGSNRMGTNTTDYSKVESYEKRADLNLADVEKFTNGYQFSKMNLEDMKSEDKDGNVVKEYSAIKMTYEKKGQEEVTLTAIPSYAEEKEEKTATKEIKKDGVVLSYNEDQMLYLPDGEKPTQKQAKREKTEEHFYISYGGDKEEIQTIKSVTFSMDGTSYELEGVNVALSAQEMIGMAEEIIENR